MAAAHSLKVFRTHLGFFDTVIAAPSMKAALDAWGTKQNLFREGLAEITNDPKAVMAALARPGVVLRRAAGSNDQFSENPILPALRATKKAREAKAAGQHKLPLPKPMAKPADRRKLDAAEKALAELEGEERKTLGELWHRRAAAEAEEARAKRDFAKRRREAEEHLEQERRAYDRALRERR